MLFHWPFLSQYYILGFDVEVEQASITNMQKELVPDAEVELKEQVTQLFMQAPVSNLVIFAVSTLFYFVFSASVDSILVPLSTACLQITASFRLYLWWLHRRSPSVLSVLGWYRVYIIACALAGASWSIIYPLSYYHSDPLISASVYLIGFGVMSSAVVILAISLPAFIVYTYPQAATLMGVFLAQEATSYSWLALALLIYTIMLTIFAHNYSRRIHAISALQRENEQLIRSLRVEVDTREQAVQARTEELQKLSQVVEQSPVAVVITDLDAKIEYVNPHFENISGYSAEELQGKNPRILQSGLTPLSRYQELWESIVRGKIWEGEFQNRSKSGAIYWERAFVTPMYDANHRMTHYLALKSDITKQKKQEEAIVHQAHYDTLTDLPNRFLALDRLSQMIKNAHRNSNHLAVIFLDLDDFKRVNDSLGHAVGDKLLVEASKRLCSLVRDNDSVCRLGGDEFVVLLAGFGDTEALRAVAGNILETFRQPFFLRGRELVVTASLGIAIYPGDGGNTSDILKKADTAMYHAKDTGRNTYHFFTEALNTKVSHLIDLEDQLHGALQHNEFEVVYQPIIDLSTLTIIGAEALLRWDNPKLGQVTPEEFVPVAERSDLIVTIGSFVLDHALANAAQWRSDYARDFKVAVNLSPRQFRSSKLVATVEGLLDKHGLKGSALELEITEGVLMSSEDYVGEAIEAFNMAEISISMDDFGTGYSSLSYLRSYPFGTLKIDKSFVEDLAVDSADRELVNASLLMAHGLGLTVVAEGVETQAQLDFLKAHHCDYAQGFLFSRPLSADSMSKLLKDTQGKIQLRPC